MGGKKEGRKRGGWGKDDQDMGMDVLMIIMDGCGQVQSR
jgi:hypothetical protein